MPGRNKFCPLAGKEVYCEDCGWFDGDHFSCAIISLSRAIEEFTSNFTQMPIEGIITAIERLSEVLQREETRR